MTADDTPTVPRVTCTPSAEALIRTLQAEDGALLFHQSGGCCDGSSPMCFVRGDFRIGETRSSVRGRALALVRLDRLASAAAPITAAGQPVSPVIADWIIQPPPKEPGADITE